MNGWTVTGTKHSPIAPNLSYNGVPLITTLSTLGVYTPDSTNISIAS